MSYRLPPCHWIRREIEFFRVNQSNDVQLIRYPRCSTLVSYSKVSKPRIPYKSLSIFKLMCRLIFKCLADRGLSLHTEYLNSNLRPRGIFDSSNNSKWLRCTLCQSNALGLSTLWASRVFFFVVSFLRVFVRLSGSFGFARTWHFVSVSPLGNRARAAGAKTSNNEGRANARADQ